LTRNKIRLLWRSLSARRANIFRHVISSFARELSILHAGLAPFQSDEACKVATALTASFRISVSWCF